MCTMITPLVRHSAGISASAAMSAAVVRIGFAGRKGLVGVHTPLHRCCGGILHPRDRWGTRDFWRGLVLTPSPSFRFRPILFHSVGVRCIVNCMGA